MASLNATSASSSSQDGDSLSPGERIFTPWYSITVTMLWLFRFVLGERTGKKFAIDAPPLFAAMVGSYIVCTGSVYLASISRYF